MNESLLGFLRVTSSDLEDCYIEFNEIKFNTLAHYISQNNFGANTEHCNPLVARATNWINSLAESSDLKLSSHETYVATLILIRSLEVMKYHGSVVLKYTLRAEHLDSCIVVRAYPNDVSIVDNQPEFMII